MKRRLKIDLHTHCGEMFSNLPPNIRMVGQIIETVKAKGLDGIAITEHKHFRYGSAVKTIVDEHFSDAGVMIIVGREIEFEFGYHVVELKLPQNRIFRFLAHPKKILNTTDGISGVEIENAMNGVDTAIALEMASKHNLVLLKNSDAHELGNIGTFYNDVIIDDATGQWFIEYPAGNLAQIK